LGWEFDQRSFAGISVTLVGHKAEFSDVRAWSNGAELEKILSRRRFFIHTAEPGLEDGDNMATLGLAVLGNLHPSSSVIAGVNRFLSDDPAELNLFACGLPGDGGLAGENSTGGATNGGRSILARSISRRHVGGDSSSAGEMAAIAEDGVRAVREPDRP
jgi:hypothetical protein